MAIRHVATIAIKHGAIQIPAPQFDNEYLTLLEEDRSVELLYRHPGYKREATTLHRMLLVAGGAEELDLPNLCRHSLLDEDEGILELCRSGMQSAESRVQRAKENLKRVRSMGIVRRLRRLGGAESTLRWTQDQVRECEESIAYHEVRLRQATEYNNRAHKLLNRVAQRQEELPVLIADELGGGEWLYRGEIYSANQPYAPDQVKLLVWEKKERERTKLERLKKQMEAGGATGEARRERITEDVRAFVWRRDGGQCVRCGRTENLEFDHVIPVSKGGSNTAKNVQLLCVECNRKKSDHI